MQKAKEISENVLQNNYTQRMLFRILVVCIAVLSIFYCYFVGCTIFNVLARKSLESNSQTLVTKISQLEFEYLERTSEIDKNYAIQNGFVESKNSIFASRAINEVAIR
jgi:hypothetical protein